MKYGVLTIDALLQKKAFSSETRLYVDASSVQDVERLARALAFHPAVQEIYLVGGLQSTDLNFNLAVALTCLRLPLINFELHLRALEEAQAQVLAEVIARHPTLTSLKLGYGGNFSYLHKHLMSLLGTHTPLRYLCTEITFEASELEVIAKFLQRNVTLKYLGLFRECLNTKQINRLQQALEGNPSLLELALSPIQGPVFSAALERNHNLFTMPFGQALTFYRQISQVRQLPVQIPSLLQYAYARCEALGILPKDWLYKDMEQKCRHDAHFF